MKNATETLDERILMLEGRKAYEFEQLKDQWHTTYESLKPVNLIKSAFHEVSTSPEVKHNLVGNLVGLATGYVSKKILFGSTHNPISKLAAGIVQFAVTNIVGKKVAAKYDKEDNAGHEETVARQHENAINR
jgi:hypothetical protein